MTRLTTCESLATAGPQLALLRAMRKSAVIWLPEIVRLTSACDDSASVAVNPSAALCRTPAEKDTAPPVRLLGILPIMNDSSTLPPDDEKLPVAARSVVPVAGTVTWAPVAYPPNVCAPADEIRARLNPAVSVVSSSSFFM